MDAEQLAALLQPYLKQKAIARLADPEICSGYCKGASFNLAAWLEARLRDSAQGVRAPRVSVLNLAEPRGFDVARAQRFWQGTNLSYAIHYAVRVGDWVVDLTARQFDSRAAFPLLSPLHELAASWGVCYDLSDPLSAGPLWRD